MTIIEKQKILNERSINGWSGDDFDTSWTYSELFTIICGSSVGDSSATSSLLWSKIKSS